MTELTQAARDKISEISRIADSLATIVIIHNFPAGLTIEYMSKMGLERLGVTLRELKSMERKYHDQFFNPKDVQFYKTKLEHLIQNNNPDNVITFFQQVKPKGETEWQWYLSSLKILCHDKNGKPLLAISHATPIDPDFHITRKVSSLLEDRTFYRENLHLFNSLSNREKEVLILLAQAKTNKEIATELFISVNTMETHKKSIKDKLNISTSTELIRFARAFDV
jgi:DNA-binding CsgD family transcriptional regulator